MIKLTDILKEISEDSYRLGNEIIEVRTAIQKFFNDNKITLKALVDKNDWNSYYNMAIKAFPNFKSSDIVQAMGNQAQGENWYIKLPIPVLNMNTGPANKPFLNIDINSDVLEINAAVDDWVRKNKKKLTKIADENNYKMFYQLAKDKFPKAQEDKLVYAVNVAAITYDIHYEISTEN